MIFVYFKGWFDDVVVDVFVLHDFDGSKSTAPLLRIHHVDFVPFLFSLFSYKKKEANFDTLSFNNNKKKRKNEREEYFCFILFNLLQN